VSRRPQVAPRNHEEGMEEVTKGRYDEEAVGLV
jgi:hypothetical protein